MDVDFSELDRLASDLGDAPNRNGRNIRKAVEVTARKIKDSWRDPLKGSVHVPLGPMSITYDVRGTAAVGGSSVEAEIGPELGRAQGPIVGILETGTPTVGGRGFGLAALQQNQADFVRGLEIAVGDPL